MALEHQWLIAFTNVSTENIYQIHSLPPYKINKKTLEHVLNELDVIWVSNIVISENQPQIVQTNLRYKLHLKPYLDNLVEKGKWFIKEIPQFGKIYQRQIL